jgi:predicted RNase H-like nuclease (RuvC/YqgF family)
MSVFPASVLYELAAVSTSDNVIDQVITGHVAPTAAAVKAAKEAERQANEAAQRARRDQELAQQQLLQERAAAQAQLDLLAREIEELTQQIARLQTSPQHTDDYRAA